MTTQADVKERRLQALIVAMQAGEDVEDRDLTVREAAQYANRLPADDNVSSVHADIQELVVRGDVSYLGKGTRCYRVNRHEPEVGK